MNCQQCNCPNQLDARYCKNCGTLLNYNLQPSNPYLYADSYNPAPNAEPANEPSLKYFYIILYFGIFCNLISLLINKIVVPAIMDSSRGFGETMSLVYGIFGWSTTILNAILITLCAVLVKNKSARTFFIIYAIISVILFLAFRFWK